eukprot:9720907-Lingulodinium_polyedra.AAC.1
MTHAILNGSTSSSACDVTGQHPTILEPTKVVEAIPARIGTSKITSEGQKNSPPPGNGDASSC